MIQNALKEIVNALANRGFVVDRSSPVGVFRFTGCLASRQGDLPAEVLIWDLSLVEYPTIRLLTRPKGLPPVVSHLNAENFLCYAARGTLVLDMYDPGGQVISCLERAEQVLDRLLSGQPQEDMQDEFLHHWQGMPTLVNLNSIKAGPALVWRAKMPGGARIFAIGSSKDATKNKVSGIGVTLEGDGFPSHVLTTDKMPGAIEGAWPPKKVGSFLNWLRALDPKCGKEASRLLLNAYDTRQNKLALIVITPRAWVGAFAVFNKRVSTDKRKFPTRTRANYAKRTLCNAADVLVLAPHRIDDTYIASRNQPGHRTLEGFRIALVGCGAVGGYLADLLVRAGAGLSGGELILIDNDELKPENLGRHFLGMKYLYKDKVFALQEALKESIPGVNLRPLPVDARVAANLEKCDLLIDATGEEGLSNWLNYRYRGGDFVPLIFTWVSGAGAAVQSFMRDRPEGACFRCLRDKAREPLFSPLLDQDTPIITADGCEGYFVPFPATASIQAAALAAEMVMDWANGSPSPRLRTRALNDAQSREIEKQDPICRKECPGCNL